MMEQKNARSLSTLAALLTLAVFAVSVLSVLLGGAQAYRRLTRRDQAVYDSRTCAQYLTMKLRQAPGPVSLSSFGEGDAIDILQTYGGEDYVVRIYCHEGWLMELFCLAGAEFDPADGEKILQGSHLSVTEEAGLIKLTMLDGSGQEVSLILTQPRTGGQP